MSKPNKPNKPNNTNKRKKKPIDGKNNKKQRNDFDFLDEHKNVHLKFVILNSLPEKTNEPEEEIIEGELEGRFGPNLFIEKTEKTVSFYKPFEKLSELISLGKTYDPSYDYKCNINMQKLHAMVEPLGELNELIGLEKFKRNIVDQIVYILTGVDEHSKPMLHTCMYGQPGVGKTAICKILAKIYAASGLLSKGHFIVAKRDDFVSKWMGDTALKTTRLLEDALGGVLFIDEVYSFGSSENKDYFAKEAVDTLNLFLSEHYRDFICIIAGYEKPIKDCFFGQNPGLERRFTYKYTINGYSSKEMSLIFKSFIDKEGWSILDKTLCKIEQLFSEHEDCFPFYGGDIKTLFDKCKINHMRKLVILDKKFWKILTYEDITEGFDLYLGQREVIKRKKSPPPFGMYI